MRSRLGGLVLALLVGCSPNTDPVTANRSLQPGDELAVRQLSAADEAEVLRAMRAAAEVDDPEIPAPALHGVRFSDVPEAVVWAAYACDMAIVKRERLPDGLRFELVTERDERAELIVRRVAPPAVVEAMAQVGSFGQRSAEAERLLKEFDGYLRAFGKKPGFEDRPPTGG